MTRRRWVWLLLVVLLVAAGAPFINADRFGPRIQAGLESALGRKVEIGQVRLHLLTGPGFSVGNVVIHEDPAFSAEPFAYVGSLVVRLRLLSLLQGRFEFSSLRLEDPSVNLMRNSAGMWNLQGLLAGTGRGAGSAPSEQRRMPELEVRSGRINFKLEDWKSVYYFTETDIDFSAAGDNSFDIWFIGEPARTDRTAQGFGRITAQGRLRDGNPEPRMDLSVQLERSALEELSTLITGRDAGVHGVVLSRGRISGPLSALKLQGVLDLAELHHWSQPPRAGSLSIGYQGKLNLPGQYLEIETEKKEPFEGHFELSKYLSSSKWKLSLSAKGLPLAPAAEWLRPTGTEFDSMSLKGAVSGDIVLTRNTPTQGHLTVTGFAWKWGDNRLEAENLEMTVDGGEAKLAPAPILLDSQPANLECGWTPGALTWQCKGTSKGLETGRLKQWTRAFDLKVPLLSELSGGQIRGSLMVSQTGMEEPLWNGALDLRNAEVTIPELRLPVKLAAASVNMQPGRVAMQLQSASAGNVEWQGSYRYEENVPRPHRLSIVVDRLRSADLERLMQPTARRSRGFLAAALGIGEESVPDWLASRRAEASVRIGVFEAGGQEFTGVRGGLLWDYEKLTLSNLTSDWLGAAVQLNGTIQLRSNGPEYALQGEVNNLEWADGAVESEWRATTRGTGIEWLRNLQVKGTVAAHDVSPPGQGPIDLLHGRFKFDVTPRGPKIELDQLEAVVQQQRFPGKATPKDGGLLVEFGGEAREIRLMLGWNPFLVTTAASPRELPVRRE